MRCARRVLGNIHPSKQAGFFFHPEPIICPGRKRIDTVVRVEEQTQIVIDLFAETVGDFGRNIVSIKDFLTVRVDALTLGVHHFIIFEQVLPDFKVAFFDFFLGALNASGDHTTFNPLLGAHAKFCEQSFQ